MYQAEATTAWYSITFIILENVMENYILVNAVNKWRKNELLCFKLQCSTSVGMEIFTSFMLCLRTNIKPILTWMKREKNPPILPLLVWSYFVCVKLFRLHMLKVCVVSEQQNYLQTNQKYCNNSHRKLLLSAFHTTSFAMNVRQLLGFYQWRRKKPLLPT